MCPCESSGEADSKVKPRVTDKSTNPEGEGGWLSRAASKVGWIGQAVVVAIIGVLATVFIVPLFSGEPEVQPSVVEQLDDVQSQAAKQGLTQVRLEQIDLRGSGGKKAYFMVLQDSELVQNSDPTFSYHSDEIRIYEVDGSDLKLKFRFRPDVLRPDVGPSFQALVWRQDAVMDLNEDGLEEVIGAFSALLWGLNSRLP